MTSENIDKFVNAFAKSLHQESFVKMTLGNYKGDDKHLQKLLLRLIKTKRGTRLFFLYRYDTRDTAKNYGFERGLKIVRSLLGSDFYSGHLFTTKNNFQLDIGKRGKSRLNTAKPTFKTKPPIEHDRKKNYLIDPKQFYLSALGITSDSGKVRDRQRDKWKQINKFVETLGKLVSESDLADKKKIRMLDMGAGKGYLTFAAYDFFRNTKKLEIEIIGIDTKQELVDLCNGIAESCGFEGLKFVHGYIDEFEETDIDVLVALHACNTATDDAIYRGLAAKCDLIVVAPCCHQEVRPQIKAPSIFKNVLKHGIILEREAESITDGLRALILEKSGYSTRVFEFISTEHTPKNNMIVGTRKGGKTNTESIQNEITGLKDFYGIKSLHLENLLNRRK